MHLLFDHNVPAPFRRYLPTHIVSLASELGWGELSNGELIAAAEKAGYAMLITADKNIRYQQNMTGRRIGIIVLPTNRWRDLQAQAPLIVEAIETLAPGAYFEIVTS